MCCEVINVKQFGAIGDGRSHPLRERFSRLDQAQAVYPHSRNVDEDEIDWAAIQAVIHTARDRVQVPTGGILTQVAEIMFPEGTYLLSSPVRTYTGVTLLGFGPGSKIKSGERFTGSALIQLEGLPQYYDVGRIDNLEFVSCSGIAAIAATAAVVGNC
jgi:hypothetical protein